jgi:uncharacterized protein YcbK (DUF882 family)
MRMVQAAWAALLVSSLVGLTGGMARATELPAGGTMGAVDVPAVPGAKVYRLRLYQLHTGESLDVVYRIGNEYVPSAVEKLNHLLRDYRTDTVTHYDLREFDLLHTIMARLGRSNDVIDIVCGYRTPETNTFLRHGTAESGVAEHSQHMESKAIDIRVPGISTARLRDAALALDAGGVGYYPVSHFVHVDVGPVRTWSFGGAPTTRMHRGAHRRRSVLHHEGE